MRLNLAIMMDDLKALSPKTPRALPWSPRRLRFATPFQAPEEPLDPEGLVIAHSEDLAGHTLEVPDRGASLFCIGTPPRGIVEKRNIALAWTDMDVSVADAMALVSRAFARYDDWHISLEKAIARGEGPKSLAQASASVLARPIWMLDVNYRTTFCVVDERYCKPHQHYVLREDGEQMSADDVNLFSMAPQVNLFGPTPHAARRAFRQVRLELPWGSNA